MTRLLRYQLDYNVPCSGSLRQKAETVVRNSILKNLANTNWGTDARTIRTTALAMCFFSSAEYASPVWSRSSHASNIDSVLNTACRAISKCLRPTRVDDLYLLCGIAPPPHVSEGQPHPSLRTQQENDPPRKRLKSRHSFLHSVEPLDGAPALEDSPSHTTPHKLSLSP